MGGTEPTDGPDLIVSFDGRTDIRLAANGAFTIGRDGPPTDMSISHPAVSRLHGRLIPGKPWHLVDYESRNGIYVDGARIDHMAPITDGMTVHLANPKGPTITFRYVNPEDTTAPSPATLAAAAGPASSSSDRPSRASSASSAPADSAQRAALARSTARSTAGSSPRIWSMPTTGRAWVRPSTT